jgi:hypothetical protein
MKIGKQRLEELTENLQNDCHKTVTAIIEGSQIEGKPDVTYQDATNVWLFKKLAELELLIEELQIKGR